MRSSERDRESVCVCEREGGGKQKKEKAAAADVNGIAVCAEAFAVYSDVAVAATADN